MVVSRSDAKRRRKEGNVLDSSLRESPKRAKVHAQRKFAQGSSSSSNLALTPIKDKEKVKNNGVVVSSELMPTKRPKTEDFLTFLCFRGTSLLPASLDLFSVASAQDGQEEDVPQHGESSGREGARNSRLTPTITPAATSQRTSRSTDRVVGESPLGQSSASVSRSDRHVSECKRRPSTAVLALRKKYQEQRLAKQKAATLRKLAQKVKGKNMIRTRSSTLKEQAVKVVKTVPLTSAPIETTKRASRSVEHKKKHAVPATKHASDKRMVTRGQTTSHGASPHDTAEGCRREGLRSGSLPLPDDSAGVHRSHRAAKVSSNSSAEQTLPEKEKKDKNSSKSFVSTLSDFSSDDDQPLVKKIKPVECSQQQHARKVVKRIVQSAKKVKSRMMTRSRVQKQDDVDVVNTRSPPPTRPTRKTKEAAALYMELLGKKLANPDADLDDDSLSVDSFPELPNARQNERRENELKAKALKLMDGGSRKHTLKNVGVKTPAITTQKSSQSADLTVKTGDTSKRDQSTDLKNCVYRQRRIAVCKKVKDVSLLNNRKVFVKGEKFHSEVVKIEMKSEMPDKKTGQCYVTKKEKRMKNEFMKKGRAAQSELTKEESNFQSEFLKKKRVSQIECVKKRNPIQSETAKDEKLQKECVLVEKPCNEIERKYVQNVNTKNESQLVSCLKKDTLSGATPKKEQHVCETTKSSNGPRKILTEAGAAAKSEICPVPKESKLNRSNSVISPRRSKRRGSQLSDCATEETGPQKNLIKPQEAKVHCKSKRPEGEVVDSLEDKFSDSDEEPLGKIALKNAVSLELVNSDKVALNFDQERVLRLESKKESDSVAICEGSASNSENRSFIVQSDKKKLKSEDFRKVFRDGKNSKPTCFKRIKNLDDNVVCSKMEVKEINKLSLENEDKGTDVSKKIISKKLDLETVPSNIEAIIVPNIDDHELEKNKDLNSESTVMKISLVSVNSIDVKKVMKSNVFQSSMSNSVSVDGSGECKSISDNCDKCAKTINETNFNFSEEVLLEESKECIADTLKNCAPDNSDNSKIDSHASSCLHLKNETGFCIGAETSTKDHESSNRIIPQKYLDDSSVKITSKEKKEHCVVNVEQCTPVAKNVHHNKIFGKRKNRRKQFQKTVPRGIHSDKILCKMEFPCRRNTLKKHMKRVSSKKYFEMNKFTNMHMFSPSKGQQDSSQNEFSSDLSLNRLELDKEVNKFDGSKVNFFTSSPLKIPSPIPSPSKKLRCKDLKGKRKVNMSTEQIEKWLNESYIEDAQEEKECGLCSKTDCKCSASSIDEELAHLSQFAMEKLTLGSGSECDALEDSRKKSSPSIGATSCCLQDVVDCEVGNPETTTTSKPDQLDNQNLASTSEAVTANSKEADLELDSLFNNSFSAIENINDSGKNISAGSEENCADSAVVGEHQGKTLQIVVDSSITESNKKSDDAVEKSVSISVESTVNCTLPSTTSAETSSQQIVLQTVPSFTSPAQPLISSHISLPSTALSYSEQIKSLPQNPVVSSQQSVTPSTGQMASALGHSGPQSAGLLFQQSLPSTLSQAVIGTTHQPVVFITSQSNNTADITIQDPKSAVISQTLQQTVNLIPQVEPPTVQQFVDHATHQSLHKAGDVIVQQSNALGQQNNSSLIVDAASVQASMPSVQQTMISSLHRSAVSSFHPTVSLPFQELTQCISSPAQQATRTITLPLQQPISQLFQHSVNSSFQQTGGIIFQQASPSPLQQSISLQLQQQAMGIPCHQTVTLPLQQLAFVPLKSVSLQLQQQVANIPLQQTIASTLPQTVSANLHQAVPLHQTANVHLQHTNSILFHQHTQLQQPTFQQQILHHEAIAPTRAMSPPKTTALPQSSEHMQQQALLHTTGPQLLQTVQAEPKQLISVQTSLTMLPQVCASLQQAATQKLPPHQIATLLEHNTYQQSLSLPKSSQAVDPCLQKPSSNQELLQETNATPASLKQAPFKELSSHQHNMSTSTELNFQCTPLIEQTSNDRQQITCPSQSPCSQSMQCQTESDVLVNQQPAFIKKQTLACASDTSAAYGLPESSEFSKQQNTDSKQETFEKPSQSIPTLVAQSEMVQQESSSSSSQVLKVSSQVVPLQTTKQFNDTEMLQPIHQDLEVNNSTPESVAVLSTESKTSEQVLQLNVTQDNSKEVQVFEQLEPQEETQPKINLPQPLDVQQTSLHTVSEEIVDTSTESPNVPESQPCLDLQDSGQKSISSITCKPQLHQKVECAKSETQSSSNENKDAGEEQSGNVLTPVAVVGVPLRSFDGFPVRVENKITSIPLHGHSTSCEGPAKLVNKNARSFPCKELGGMVKNEKICEKYVAHKATNLRVVRIRKDIDKDQSQERKHFVRTGSQSQILSNTNIPDKVKSSKFYSKLIVQRGPPFKLLGEKPGRGLGRKDSASLRKQRIPSHTLEKKSIFQKSRSFPQRVSEQKRPLPNTNAFSLEDESSVYAFKTELELPPINTPFRRRARDSRTSSTTTSRSEEDLTKALDDDPLSPLVASPPENVAQQVSEKLSPSVAPQQASVQDHGSTPSSKCVGIDSPVFRNSASIAVQVNLDNEPSPEPVVPTVVVSEPSPVEPVLQRSMECSTQTEVSEEDENDGHLFYIPLQHAADVGGQNVAPSQQLIQGVTVKLGTEGSAGSNQCVIMRAKLVTKPPSFSCTPAIQDAGSLATRRTPLMSQHQRSSNAIMMEQKFSSSVVPPLVSTSSTYPPVGTVQPTARAKPIVSQCDAMTGTSDRSAGQAARKSVHVSTKACVVSDSGSQTAGASGLASRAASRPQHRHKFDFVSSRRGSVEQPASSPLSAAHKSSSTTVKRGIHKSKTTRSCEVNYLCSPVSVAKFPAVGSRAQLVEAPIYHPTEKEFQDPLEYIDKIRPVAEKFGLCRIVPPSNFKPECKVTDDMRFTAYNQYVHKMLHRWGPNVMEMMAIKKYLATQSIALIHPPLIGGMEVDLPRLYQTVQSFGGLKDVIEKKKWQRVAEGMKIPKSAQERATKLDDIYCKYLLPYDTLSPAERNRLFAEVEKEWNSMEGAGSSQDSATTSDTPEEEADDMSEESQECIVKGRSMPLNAFYRIARNTMSMWFRQPEPSAAEVEQEFWKHVMTRQCHVCVHSGSIDSSGWGYGFPCSKNSPFARHPWNLKVLTNNSGSILRSMGPVMGVTVPTLHVGMVFTTCCWYRDPHGLPWIEYLHTGAKKIWYGIPDEYSFLFRAALSKLVPRYCRNKTIWLPSDTAMVPPSLLVKEGVSLCHTVQEPGQFILVFPRAFTSTICAGYLVSESVYFAQPSWLTTAEQVFKDIQESCEPSVFSLERLLFSVATDTRSHVDVLKQVLPMILRIRQQELDNRKELYSLGLKNSERLPLPDASIKRRKSRPARDEDGDYECEICRANLFVSLVTNSHEEGVYCLPHAIQLLTKKRHHLKFCKLMYTYDQSELNELVQKLEDKIEAKSQRKALVKHCSSGQKI